MIEMRSGLIIEYTFLALHYLFLGLLLTRLFTVEKLVLT